MPLRLTLTAAFALLLAACAHYRLGTSAAPAFSTLYIEPVQNKTTLAQSAALVGTQIRESFLRDARVTLVNSPAAADATLQVVLVDYSRAVAAPRSDDTGLARKFELALRAECTLRDQRTGRTWFERRPVGAMKESYTDSGQLLSEYDTAPLLASSLADNIAHAVLDVW
ncbi:MAG TPA: LPS assembly lipoprotein LptE [Opitutaceae bacterium]|nr:LPS assembly lipoprotein LptE [Opitutaceae bacterium]